MRAGPGDSSYCNSSIDYNHHDGWWGGELTQDSQDRGTGRQHFLLSIINLKASSNDVIVAVSGEGEGS